MRYIELIGVPGVGKSTIARVAIATYPNLLCVQPPSDVVTGGRRPECLIEIAAQIEKTGAQRLRRAATMIQRASALHAVISNEIALVDSGPAQQGLSLALEGPSSASLDRYFGSMPAPDGIAYLTAERSAVIERNQNRVERGGKDLSHMRDALAPIAERAVNTILAARGIPTVTINTMNPVVVSAQKLRDFAAPLATIKTLRDYREDHGYLWPAADPKAPRLSRLTVEDIAVALAYCRRRNIVVQAGGNCGVWPRRMADLFNTVYTFEPDARNFTALAVNTADCGNVIRFQAALGDGPGFVDLERHTVNCGAHYVCGAGPIPVMRVDDLALPACDLIYLDIEGYESKALNGAVQTIAKYRPVIAVEDKGLSEKFGTPQGHIEAWLARDFGYRVAERVRKDVIMVPA